jgi:hypothetical protein
MRELNRFKDTLRKNIYKNILKKKAKTLPII